MDELTFRFDLDFITRKQYCNAYDYDYSEEEMKSIRKESPSISHAVEFDLHSHQNDNGIRLSVGDFEIYSDKNGQALNDFFTVPYEYEIVIRRIGSSKEQEDIVQDIVRPRASEDEGEVS